MGELLAHFEEKKWDIFGKKTTFSRNFHMIFPSVDIIITRGGELTFLFGRPYESRGPGCRIFDKGES